MNDRIEMNLIGLAILAIGFIIIWIVNTIKNYRMKMYITRFDNDVLLCYTSNISDHCRLYRKYFYARAENGKLMYIGTRIDNTNIRSSVDGYLNRDYSIVGRVEEIKEERTIVSSLNGKLKSVNTAPVYSKKLYID